VRRTYVAGWTKPPDIRCAGNVLHPDTSFEGKGDDDAHDREGDAPGRDLRASGRTKHAGLGGQAYDREVRARTGAEEWFTLPDITCDGFTEEMTLERISVTIYLDGDVSR
jgi:hypothetical protein